jgi:hypothetical protein
MRLVVFTFLLSLVYSNVQSQDTLRKPRRVTPIIFSAVSYQLAVNGGKADSNLGNFGFKGYIQPQIGLGLKYQQDSTEFATVGLSATRFVFTLASSNVLYDNGNEYPIVNRVDVYMNNYALTTAYHRRLTHKSRTHFFSLELGAGVHLIHWYGTVHSDETTVGPYSVVHAVNTPKRLYALPTASAGLNCVLVSRESKTNFLIGINSELYLDNFWPVNYNVDYQSSSTLLQYHFSWAPVILAPKVYVMAMF